MIRAEVIRAVALLIAGLALGACRQAEPPAEPAKVATTAAPSTPPANDHEAGRRIYNFRCYYCHGYSGDARTLAASFLRPAPRNFQAATVDGLPREAMLRAVAGGVTGSAMAAFRHTLSPREIELVVDFVREEFIVRKARNTSYHTAANGWPDHEKYRSAFPFATGEIPLDRPWDELDAVQSRGKQLYLSACVSCHDRGRVVAEGKPWELRGVSYPPGNYTGEEDAEHDEAAAGGTAAVAAKKSETEHGSDGESATIAPYELHDVPPKLLRPSALVQRGERLYQGNCAFCHAADGTGRNWIGSFLEPHPPDFTAPELAGRLTRQRVATITRDGMPGTSMSAWKQVLSPPEIEAISAYVADVFGTGIARAAAKPAGRVATAR